MYQLYYSPSTAALVVHWLLIELNIEHQLKPINLSSKEQKSAEYLKINPNGVVPTLLIDGKPMTEAAAISIYLADKHALGSFSPALDSPLRGDYLQWMFYFANTMQPAYRQWFYPQDFGGEAVIKPIAQKTIETAFTRIDQQLSDGRHYFLGDKLTTVDLFATMLMRWSRNMPKPATEWPQIKSLVTKMRARPAFKELYKREGITDWT